MGDQSISAGLPKPLAPAGIQPGALKGAPETVPVSAAPPPAEALPLPSVGSGLFPDDGSMPNTLNGLNDFPILGDELPRGGQGFKPPFKNPSNPIQHGINGIAQLINGIMQLMMQQLNQMFGPMPGFGQPNDQLAGFGNPLNSGNPFGGPIGGPQGGLGSPFQGGQGRGQNGNFSFSAFFAFFAMQAQGGVPNRGRRPAELKAGGPPPPAVPKAPGSGPDVLPPPEELAPAPPSGPGKLPPPVINQGPKGAPKPVPPDLEFI